ncbi:Predicted metal-dependent hydrolase (beta-lactamase superfamily) [Phaffia rhodozyma]|uniref:Predicted metal-dependent hydrolase (Beta-lactamase superfamily) n=1 Tax=Phaffia rhodozyma TaxID=264483 RepID=A0A0F7STE7_PHARH|nr:Predicted metal-dependent hydrolase (beta-lactamase superfamily) [Phaffia rhodozyma]
MVGSDPIMLTGGGPTRSRNCSSVALTQDGRSTLVDCADGTYRQMITFGFKPSSVNTILITHLHGDHVLGLVPLLASILSGVSNSKEFVATLRTRNPSPKPSVNIYGPKGLRSLVRITLSLTSMELGGVYTVHELLLPGEELTSCAAEDMHLNEVPGKNIFKGENGWENISDDSFGLVIDAGEILHRVTSLGYVLRYPRTPLCVPVTYLASLKQHGLSPALLGKMLRTGDPIELPTGEQLNHPGWDEGYHIAVLGDTSDASGMLRLARGVNLLIHECTNAHIPKDPNSITYPNSKGMAQTFDSIREKSALRGHSTPDVAGGFARAIMAKHLVLNHFSTMFSTSEEFSQIALQARVALLNTAAVPGSDTTNHSDGNDAQGDQADPGRRKVICSEDGMRLKLKSVKGVRVDEVDVDDVLEITRSTYQS